MVPVFLLHLGWAVLYPVFISDAKPLQMLHHFLFPMSTSFFFLSVQSGHSLKKAHLCYSQAHRYLGAVLFSFLLPLFSFEYPREICQCVCYPFLSC